MFHLIKDVVVMDLTNEAYNSITKYFSTLTYTGYKSDSEVFKLLVFIFVEELLYGPLSQFVTDKDYKIIKDAINCLYGSCMIPFPDYKRSYDPIINRMYNKYRITENAILRNSEDDKLRVKS